MCLDLQEVAFDYLSPFMPNIAGTRGLTRDEALVVREACLKALKERLIERANIIQVLIFYSLCTCTVAFLHVSRHVDGDKRQGA